MTVKSTSVSGGNTTYVLDYKPTGTVQTALSGGGVANPLEYLPNLLPILRAISKALQVWLRVLMMFTYSNKIVVQEIKDAAKRESGDSTTSGNDALVFTECTDKTGGNISEYKLNAITTTTNWVDDRSPAFKIGYDETNQRLTFDGVNTFG